MNPTNAHLSTDKHIPNAVGVEALLRAQALVASKSNRSNQAFVTSLYHVVAILLLQLVSKCPFTGDSHHQSIRAHLCPNQLSLLVSCVLLSLLPTIQCKFTCPRKKGQTCRLLCSHWLISLLITSLFLFTLGACSLSPVLRFSLCSVINCKTKLPGAFCRDLNSKILASKVAKLLAVWAK